MKKIFECHSVSQPLHSDRGGYEPYQSKRFPNSSAECIIPQVMYA